MKSRERSLSQTPLFVVVGLVFFGALQFSHHYFLQTAQSVDYRHLDEPLDARSYLALSMGSDKLVSYLLLLKVQLHDNQKGSHINYRHLDYAVLSRWLLTLGKLNLQSDYAAFLASRVYSQVPDTGKIRQMINVIETLFRANPEQHWRRMAEACLLAKHQLKDLPRALELAQQVADLPVTVKIPYWARDMRLVLLDELDQYESAQLLISSLLQSGEIKDPDEIRFLQQRLLKIQQKMLENEQN